MRIMPINRRGFSLVETNISALLGGLLLLMISGVWTGVGRSVVDTSNHGYVVTEAALAVESLRRDLCGSLPEDQSGSLQIGRRIGQLNVAGHELHLCFEGLPENGVADWNVPDTVIEYRVLNGQLLRENLTRGTSVVIADGVTRFEVSDSPYGHQIDLTLQRGSFSRDYIIVAPLP